MKLAPQLLLALVVGVACELFNPLKNVYLRFAVNGIILVASYFVTMWFFGFNTYEKDLIFGSVKKVIKKIQG